MLYYQLSTKLAESRRTIYTKNAKAERYLACPNRNNTEKTYYENTTNDFI